jgi:hypothetical protein
LVPYEQPITAMTKPISSGAKLPAGAWLRLSISAAISTTRIAVPTSWSTTGPR